MGLMLLPTVLNDVDMTDYEAIKQLKGYEEIR
jgi:hypothetical protein